MWHDNRGSYFNVPASKARVYFFLGSKCTRTKHPCLQGFRIQSGHAVNVIFVSQKTSKNPRVVSVYDLVIGQRESKTLRISFPSRDLLRAACKELTRLTFALFHKKNINSIKIDLLIYRKAAALIMYIAELILNAYVRLQETSLLVFSLLYTSREL